ncbi:oligosaccharide flippase family protein [Oceanobacillus luteolus]|uniref:oligosaccharide flippase family protein n=1 Tax=Oceanobacillus luteolus TaxID=1274358 RepID=UPI0020406BF8|nr:oligosaccharide flippase family protein [Oceanobacillus luteolus]MCM3741802.1 oligosaccharide flippase family protein [Oceanobacillus luteolus]
MSKIFRFIFQRKRFISFSILRILSMVLGLVSNIIIVRELSVGDFGIFSVTLLVVNLLTTFGFNWSSSSILYFGSKEREKYGTLNKTFWSRNIIIFISLFIVTIGIFLFRDQINNYIGLNIWFLLLVWLYVSVAENYLNQYFLAVKKQITSSLLSITAKVIYILLILFIPFDVVTLIIIYIISHASVLFYILGMNKRDIGRFEFDKSWFKELLNFSLWQLFGFAGIYLLNFGDIAVVKYYMTNEDVGLYNAAYQLFNAVAGFSYVISSYYAPSISSYFTSNKTQPIKAFYYKERIYIIIASIGMHLVAITLSKPIITILYGQEYLKSVTIFNILMFASMIKYVTVFYMLFYNSNGKHAVLQMLNIAIAIVNVLLSIILIQMIGLVGPAVGTVLTLLLGLLFSFIYCEMKIIKFIKAGE